MNQEPLLFSILIANYNNGRYLQEAIDSVLAQTYTNWEVVLVDDKSIDNSFEIYEKYKEDPRFRIYYNEKNMGCGYTKRRCVELAKGELCGFLDPDDKLDAEVLELVVPEHIRLMGCAVVYTTTYRWNDVSGNVSVLERVGKIDDDEDYLISQKKSVFHFASFKKSFYDKTEGIDAALRTGVDFDMFLKLEEVGGLYYIDRPMYYYRQTNPNSISGIGSKTPKSQINADHMTGVLNAFKRRIKNSCPLFERNKDRYLKQMRWALCYYKSNKGEINIPLLNYCYWYLVGNGFSIASFNHIRKVLFYDKCLTPVGQNDSL